MRSLVLIAMPMLLACAIAAAAAAADQDKIDSLIHEFADITHDLPTLQAAQEALMQQKAGIDATAADLAKRQDALNQQEQAHNQLAAEQKDNLAQSQTACNGPDTSSTAMHTKDCDEVIKKLNKQNAVINAGIAPLQAQQSDIDLAYGQYNQAANDWSVREQETMTSLNSLYRALNQWADQADGLIGSESFQTEMYADHAERHCPRHGLPSGTLHIEELIRYADGADSCLKYIAAQRRAAHAGH